MGTELLTKLAIINEISKIIVYDNLSRGHRSLFLEINQLFIQNSFCSWRNIGLPLLKKQLNDADVLINLAAMVTTPFANTDPHFLNK